MLWSGFAVNRFWQLVNLKLLLHSFSSSEIQWKPCKRFGNWRYNLMIVIKILKSSIFVKVKIISFFFWQVKDIELCGSDTITFKNGNNPITPTLKTLTSSSKAGEVILSTGNRMYVYMNLKEHMKCRGVLLAYRAGNDWFQVRVPLFYARMIDLFFWKHLNIMIMDDCLVYFCAF